MVQNNNVIGLQIKRRLQDISDIKRDSDESVKRSLEAKENADKAKHRSDITKKQLDEALRDGDQVVEVQTLRVDPITGKSYNTAADRFEDNQREVKEQLEQKAHQHMIDISQPPYNILGGGDVTAALNSLIQSASLDEKTIYIPDIGQEVKVNPDVGIVFRNNTTMIIDDNVVFKALPTDKERYRVFKLNNVKNVKVHGRFFIVGERNEHLGFTGEWGHGVEIQGSSNIYFEYLNVIDCWGDGLYIGSTSEKNYSEDIEIGTLVCDNNRRQGLSVISVKGLQIGKAYLTRSNGTAPSAGVDFEPNNNQEFLQDINIDYLHTAHNEGNGMLTFFGSYVDSPNFVDITIGEHISIEDNQGSCSQAGGNIEGNIVVNASTYVKSGYHGIEQRNYPSTNPLVTYKNPVIIDPLELDGRVSNRYSSAVSMFRHEEDTTLGVSGDYIGNIKIENLQVIDTRVVKKVVTGVFCGNFRESGKARNVSIINPTRIDALDSKIYAVVEDLVLKDDNNILVKHMENSNLRVESTDLNKTYTTKGNTSNREIELTASLPVGTEIEIVLLTSEKLTITSGSRVVPIETMNGKKISAFGLGNRIRIKKIDSGLWHVTKMIGNWIEEDD